MTINVKNGPLAALAYVLGIDASNKGSKAKLFNASTSAPGTTNDNTQGYFAGLSIWSKTDTRQVYICMDASTNAAVWTQLELSDHPGYISGNWYVPNVGVYAAGTAPGTGSIRAYPFILKARAALNSLGLRVTTTNAGNVQAAIYANNAASMRPTGNALASTASMSTASAASVNAAISVTLEPGIYWFASNCDNATAAFASMSSGATFFPSIIGSTTQSNVISAANNGIVGVTVSQTFGTWPDLTAGSFTENTSGASTPMVQFKVA